MFPNQKSVSVSKSFFVWDSLILQNPFFLNLDNESVVKCRHMKRANTNQLTVKEFWESRLISKIGHGMVSKLFVQIK